MKGHDHFWERVLSRRALIGGGAGTAAGLVSASNLWLPDTALAAGSDPKPINGGLAPTLHVNAPDGTAEQNMITDFDGVLGVAHRIGNGTGITNGVSRPMYFDTDMRFADGLYIGMDGVKRRGAFGFV